MFLLALAIFIDINTATLSQLDELTGIGPVYAQRIIDGRPYSSVDDLDRVKGIGPATLKKIKDQGLACVNCEQEEVGPPENSHADFVEVGPPKTYPNGVFINEILPSPKSADETDEYIELYNSNNFDVDLTGWQIKDTNGTPTIFTISKNIKILANNFLVFKRPETKIMLNNDIDGLTFLTPNKKTVDSINFVKALVGQSYNKISDKWLWSATLTPGAKNIIGAAKTALNVKSLPNAKNSVKNNIEEKDLPVSSNPWILFLIALVITIISAFSVLFIKLKIKKNVRT